LVLERHVGEVGCDLLHHLTPEPRGLEHVGLVHRGHQPASLPGEHEGQPRDASYLAVGVDHRVHRTEAAVEGLAQSGFPEVDAAGELADDQHIDSFEQLGPQR
jgi:hypothetical protein